MTLRPFASLLPAALLCLSTASIAVAQEPVEPSPMADPSDPADPVGSAALDGGGSLEPEGTWEATAFDAFGGGLIEPAARSRLTVSFLADARLEGGTACGGYIGSWSVDGQSIRIGILTTGTSPCGEARRDEEIAFTQALTAVTSWAATASGLELRDASGATRVVLEPAQDASVLGDWIVRRYAGNDGALRAPIEGAEVSVAFRTGERMDGSSGCRFFEGSYFVEADRIVIGPLEEVGLPCEGAIRRQENRYLRALGNALTWIREGSDLRLLDATGQPVVQLEERPA